MPNIVYDRFDNNFIVLAMGEMPPTNAEWGSFVDYCSDRSMVEPVVLVHTNGGFPSGTQRAALAKAMAVHPRARVAVLASSAFARGAVTALGWLYGSFRAFEPDRIDEAIAYLDRPRQRATAERLLARCGSRLQSVVHPSSDIP